MATKRVCTESQFQDCSTCVQGDDVELIDRLRGLLRLDVVMVLLIGMQAICAGIIGVPPPPSPLLFSSPLSIIFSVADVGFRRAFQADRLISDC